MPSAIREKRGERERQSGRAENALSAVAAIALFDCQNLFALPRNKVGYTWVCVCVSCLLASLTVCLSLNLCLYFIRTRSPTQFIYSRLQYYSYAAWYLSHVFLRSTVAQCWVHIDSLLILGSITAHIISLLLPGLKVCAYRVKRKREHQIINNM